MKPKKPGEQPSGASACHRARLSSSGTNLSCNDGAKSFGTPLGTYPVLQRSTPTPAQPPGPEHALQGCLAMRNGQTAVCDWVRGRQAAWH